MNLPTTLTWLRILMIPVFLLFFLNHPPPFWRNLAAATFLLASATDFLDGYLARRRGQVTTVGQFMDPIADKLLVTTALVLLVWVEVVPLWLAALIIGREVVVTGLRAIIYRVRRAVLVPQETGKYKFLVQVAAITLLIVDYRTGQIDLHLVGLILLGVSLILALISATEYVMAVARK